MNRWLTWAMELQALAQTGLYYTKDVYDRERFERIRTIAAEMVQAQSDLPLEKVQQLFCGDVGYQTPKIDTRAAVIKDNKILLVQEKNGQWALPGGWCDFNCSVKENALKELREEAGVEATADYLIAVLDREKHNKPAYLYKITTVYVMCTAINGAFVPNTETQDAKYFPFNDLPPLSEERTTEAEIRMCFDAWQKPN